jgi:hypothetical protein
MEDPYNHFLSFFNSLYCNQYLQALKTVYRKNERKEGGKKETKKDTR